MTTKEALQKARDLIAQPGAWTRYAYARDRDGNQVLALDDRAVCWCALGAVIRVTGKAHVGSEEMKRIVGMQVMQFNDAQESVEPVLAMFDACIASLE